MRIVIVGAGVAGCILTRTLSRLPGLDVTCLERVSAGEHSQVGAGLNICPNGPKALRPHDAELADAITAASFPWRACKVSLTDGTVLLDLPLAQVADNEGWRIGWSDFYRILRGAAAPAVSYGCTITHMAPCECDTDKTCIEWSQDGVERRLTDIDLLVATDGRHSQVRWTISGAPAVRHLGVAISRMLVPDTSGGLIGDHDQWFNGPNRLLGFRVPPDHVYATCTFPIPPDEPIPEALKEPEALRALYMPPSGKLSPAAAWTLDRLCANAADLHWTRMQEHDVLYADPHWNVLYLGDAAHGMAPALAQGVAQAVEDVAVAGDIIAREWAAGCRDPRRWLRLIARARLERMRFAMQLSVEATETMLEGADPAAGLMQKMQPGFLARLRSLYSDVAGNLTSSMDGASAGARRRPVEGLTA
ncbi:MAG TPA: NAD(P)/FAD-dependent oxidoreductase [Hyphomicrobiaceae bacterium]|nr:NAD(P)/FAD-dependent oxidoreductase [Hyphomicrobiaceae bacterium]